MLHATNAALKIMPICLLLYLLQAALKFVHTQSSPEHHAVPLLVA